MSELKEPHYFCHDEWRERYYYRAPIIKDRAAYLDLFNEASSDCRYVGEATAHYLPSMTAAEAIYRENPSSRIIVILRDPVDRAFSHYLMDNSKLDRKIMGGANYSFDEILSSDKADCSFLRREYLELGCYGEQLERFLSVFPRENLFIGLYEEISSPDDGLYRDICGFLDLAYDSSERQVARSNAYSEPSSKVLRAIYKNRRVRTTLGSLTPGWLGSRLKSLAFSKTKPAMSEEAKRYLTEYYSPHIKKANSLLDGMLDHWRY